MSIPGDSFVRGVLGTEVSKHGTGWGWPDKPVSGPGLSQHKQSLERSILTRNGQPYIVETSPRWWLVVSSRASSNSAERGLEGRRRVVWGREANTETTWTARQDYVRAETFPRCWEASEDPCSVTGRQGRQFVIIALAPAEGNKWLRAKCRADNRQLYQPHDSPPRNLHTYTRRFGRGGGGWGGWGSFRSPSTVTDEQLVENGNIV